MSLEWTALVVLSKLNSNKVTQNIKQSMINSMPLLVGSFPVPIYVLFFYLLPSLLCSARSLTVKAIFSRRGWGCLYSFCSTRIISVCMFVCMLLKRDFFGTNSITNESHMFYNRFVSCRFTDASLLL